MNKFLNLLKERVRYLSAPIENPYFYVKKYSVSELNSLVPLLGYKIAERFYFAYSILYESIRDKELLSKINLLYSGGSLMDSIFKPEEPVKSDIDFWFESDSLSPYEIKDEVFDVIKNGPCRILIDDYRILLFGKSKFAMTYLILKQDSFYKLQFISPIVNLHPKDFRIKHIYKSNEPLKLFFNAPQVLYKFDFIELQLGVRLDPSEKEDENMQALLQKLEMGDVQFQFIWTEDFAKIYKNVENFLSKQLYEIQLNANEKVIINPYMLKNRLIKYKNKGYTITDNTFLQLENFKNDYFRLLASEEEDMMILKKCNYIYSKYNKYNSIYSLYLYRS